MTVLHKWQRHVSTFMPIGCVVLALFTSSAIFLVMSSGRSVVQASQQRKSIELCRVQIGQVHPVGAAGAGGGSKVTGGLFSFLGTTLGCFVVRFSFSVTSRLTCRGGSLIGGVLASGAVLDRKGEGGASLLIDPSGRTSPPPLPIGFAGVDGMYDSPYSFF